MKFSQNFFENWRFWKTQFFWVGPFGILSSKHFFLLHPHGNQSKLLGYQGWVEIFMITLVYRKRVSVRNNLLHIVQTFEILERKKGSTFRTFSLNFNEWQTSDLTFTSLHGSHSLTNFSNLSKIDRILQHWKTVPSQFDDKKVQWKQWGRNGMNYLFKGSSYKIQIPKGLLFLIFVPWEKKVYENVNVS